MAIISKVSLIALLLVLANKVHSQDVTSFTYDSFPPNPTTLTYQGEARVLPGSTVLSLTGLDASGEKERWVVGRVLYSKPIKFWESSPRRQATFETTIRFLIEPSKNGAAEGVAFFIGAVGTTVKNSTIGGNLGIYNSGVIPDLFAVEFDTNYNGWDPTYHHVGINVQSRTSAKTARFNAGTGEVVTVRINYNPNTRTITVVANSASQSAEISHVFDLKNALPEEVQVGLTSSTGTYIDYVGIPSILSWYFTSSLVYTSVNHEDTYIQQIVDMQ